MPELKNSLATALGRLSKQLVPQETDEERGQYEWRKFAREEQVSPPGEWTTWLFLAGRGSGKSRAGAEWVREGIESGECRRVLLGAPTAADARDVMIEGPSGLLNVCPPWNRPKYEPSKRRLTWPNGAIATHYSGDEAERVRGPQHDRAWCIAGDSLILMGDGSQKKISDISAGEYVQTRKGARLVLWSGLTNHGTDVLRLTTLDGRVIIGTPDHPIWVVGKGFVPLSRVTERDEVLCVTDVSSGVGIRGTSNKAARTHEVADTTNVGRSFIVLFGKQKMERYRAGMSSIIKTVISLITDLKIWKWFLPANTVRTTAWTNFGHIAKKQLRAVSRLWRGPLPSGRKEFSFAYCAEMSTTAAQSLQGNSARPYAPTSTVLEHFPAMIGHANTAESCTTPQGEYKDTAQGNVTNYRRQRGYPTLLPWKSSVQNVERNLSAKEATQGSVVENVLLTTTVRIKSVEKCLTRVDVYNLNVDGEHEFFANGIVVHNCDELCYFRYGETFLSNLLFGLRAGENPQLMISTTPKPVPILLDLIKQKSTVMTKCSTYANIDNLAGTYKDQVIARYEGTRLGRQELYAEILEDIEGALWQREWIDGNRVKSLLDAPDMVRVVVGVDPMGSIRSAMAETGIVVAGLGSDGHGYVLADYSLHGTPEQWAGVVVSAFHTHSADRVVVERNFGGDMVVSTLRAIEENLPIKEVVSARGKILRAEPVAALAEQGKLHHVGLFTKLEEEMCRFVVGEPSPNHLDAMAFCLTDLMLEQRRGMPIIEL